MAREEELGAGDVLWTDAEDAPESLDERPSAFEPKEVTDVGAGCRAHETEQDDQDDRVVAGRRPRRGGKQEDLAWKRNAGALDEDAKPRGWITERVDDRGWIHGASYTDGLMAEYGEHEATDDPLQVLRHSAAHLLAAAVMELYPDAKYGIGPPVQDGFYYDFQFSNPVSESDLGAIESRMRRIVNEDRPFVHETLSRADAVAEFRKRGQDYKLELIADKVEGDEVSVYRTGDFLDLCRGPHVRSTRDLKAFKLLRVAGAYWRGDEKKPQLTRIYGTAWQTPKELDDYLKFLEEAEKRDHKKLGKELKLFALDDRLGLGQVVWLPDGATIRRELERWIVDEELKRGYRHVITPHLAKLGQNYRLEKSGELMGMVRVRSFNLNDAHIFCTPEQVIGEVRGAIELANYFMSTLGVEDYWYRLSVRDNVKTKWAGTDG